MRKHEWEGNLVPTTVWRVVWLSGRCLFCPKGRHEMVAMRAFLRALPSCKQSKSWCFLRLLYRLYARRLSGSCQLFTICEMLQSIHSHTRFSDRMVPSILGIWPPERAGTRKATFKNHQLGSHATLPSQQKCFSGMCMKSIMKCVKTMPESESLHISPLFSRQRVNSPG